MVRDDFWMAATRFMRDLEIPLLEGENSAAVDLFDRDHARKVLMAFGRAFGRLPENAPYTSRVQKDFLEESVNGLAEAGKVISVRLAIYAEMMKGKALSTSSLEEVGGTKGWVSRFWKRPSRSTAPPAHRLHQNAARAVLRALLPETRHRHQGANEIAAGIARGVGLCGTVRATSTSWVRILDRGLRLITPTDPEGKEADSDSGLRTGPGQKYHQLTHDYLVPSLRRIVNAQAEGNAPRAGGATAVGNCRPLERGSPRPASAVVVGST